MGPAGSKRPIFLRSGRMSEAPAEAAAGSGASSGYYYWHDSVNKGEGAAPIPEHKPVTVATEAVEEHALTIDNFAFMDDEGVVKIYIKLEGDLATVTAENVELKVERQRYEPICSMLVHVRGANNLHRL